VNVGPLEANAALMLWTIIIQPHVQTDAVPLDCQPMGVNVAVISRWALSLPGAFIFHDADGAFCLRVRPFTKGGNGSIPLALEVSHVFLCPFGQLLDLFFGYSAHKSVVGQQFVWVVGGWWSRMVKASVPALVFSAATTYFLEVLHRQ
jgi:hypothetical protein